MITIDHEKKEITIPEGTSMFSLVSFIAHNVDGYFGDYIIVFDKEKKDLSDILKKAENYLYNG